MFILASRKRLGRRHGVSVSFSTFNPGVDVVDWLASHVQGFQDRKEAKKFANLLLKAGLIRHTVNKLSFSEQCYYVFGDLCSGTWDCGRLREVGLEPQQASVVSALGESQC